MNHLRNSHPKRTASASNGSAINRKKRKRKFFQINGNVTNASTNCTSAVTEEHDDPSKALHPSEKRRRNNNKKAPEEVPAEKVKPVLVKNPEDYSANWKKLKEIMAQEDKKTSSGSPVIRDKNKDNFNRKRRHRELRGMHQKTNEAERTSNEAENQEADTKDKEELDIWFDNVDPILLEGNTQNKDSRKSGIKTNNKSSSNETLVKEEAFTGATKVVAMDCEMVGVGMNGTDSMLARVSLVNHYGKVLYDKFVKPAEEVVDYRTPVSGIRPADLENGCDFSTVQKEVSDLIEGRILVGHAIKNDLRVLYISHPRADIRDTARYRDFVRKFGGRTPSLKKLVERFLGVQIQQGEHDSVQDAQAAMRLYTMHRREWEKSRRNKFKKGHRKTDFTSATTKLQTSEAS